MPCSTTSVSHDRQRRSPFTAVADKCRLSERTVRDAFCGRAVTMQSASRIAKAIGIDLYEFRIKPDNRGKKNNQRKDKTK